MLLEMILWRQWNEKKLRGMMNMVLAVERSLKWMMPLNIWMMPLKKILEINYTYGSMTQPTAKEILWRVTIYLFLRESTRDGGYSE